LKRELNHIRWGEIEKHTRGINETKIDHLMPFLDTDLQTNEELASLKNPLASNLPQESFRLRQTPCLSG
jgi:hypothetical protein